MDVIDLPLGQIAQELGVVYFRVPVGHFHMARTPEGGAKPMNRFVVPQRRYS